MPPSLDDKLAALRALRGQELTTQQKDEVRKRVGDKSNFVAAAAAEIAGQAGLVEYTKDLEAAFERFLVDPVKTDKLCRAKLAIVQALDKLEHADSVIFRKAAIHVQLEPAWGKPVDSAPPLRSAGIVALVRTEGAGCSRLLVDALVDPEKEVRITAANALGAVGSEAAGLVLRLKVKLGDADPDVFSECLGGLLAVDPIENMPIVTGFLDPMNEDKCEAAALALGRSRLDAALEPLAACWKRAMFPDLKQQLLLAIALLRRPAATDFLVELAADEPEPTALAAISALRIFKADPRLRERIESVLKERGNAKLRAAFARELGAEG